MQWMTTENWTALGHASPITAGLLWQHCGTTRSTFTRTGYPKAHVCGDSGAILSIIAQGVAYTRCGPERRSR